MRETYSVRVVGAKDVGSIGDGFRRVTQLEQAIRQWHSAQELSIEGVHRGFKWDGHGWCEGVAVGDVISVDHVLRIISEVQQLVRNAPGE